MASVAGAQPLTKTEIEQGLQRLPALSETVMQLLELTQRDNVDVDQVAHTIAQDPSLSARLLRVANSPFFGLAGEVTSINQSCMVLGMNTVRNLAVAVGVGSCFNSDNDEQRQLWQQAMVKAFAAQSLAHRCGHNSETAFTAGMLHDLGKMVMVACFAETMQKTHAYQDAHGCELAEAELAFFGMDHRGLGAMLASRWCLPELIRQVIASCSETEGGVQHPMVDIVTLANLISNNAAHVSAEKVFQSLPVEVVLRLGLDSTEVQAWLEDVEKNRTMADLLA